MDPTTVPIEAALPAVRALLDAAAIPYRFVGGVAVVHHGYARTTDDIDVLVHGRAAVSLAARSRSEPRPFLEVAYGKISRSL